MGAQARHATRGGRQGIGVAPLQATQLLPAQGHRHRRAFACAQRERCHAGRTPAIAEVIDEDASLAEFLGRGRDIGERIGRRHGFGERVREVLHPGPRTRRLQRHHDVQALTSGRAHVGGQSERTQQRSHLPGGGHHATPRHIGAGVEIEHDAVRQLGGLRMRAPWMEFDRVELRQFEQPGLIVHHQIVRACATLFFQRHHVDALHARRMVLLEETRPARALRTTDDRQRATLDFRQQPSCHRTVIVEDLPFCDATVGEYHAFGVRQCDRLRIGTAGSIGRRHRRFLCVS